MSHASTAATAASAFAADEPLEPRGAAAAADARGTVARVTALRCSPAAAAVETAAALGLGPGDTSTTADALRDWDLGRWRGRTLDDVAGTDPAAVTEWLSDPAAAPHGGEPLVGVLARVADLLADPALVAGDDRAPHVVLVTHAAVVRAAVLSVLGAPPQGFWRIDVAPLTSTVLRGAPGRWTLRTLAHPLASPARG
ncbi:probable phosphoglycerate mutase [Pseudonocardia sp. N23]|nr:probable phosphoglycerate mutase [Pseudonocardia sp. N23]